MIPTGRVVANRDGPVGGVRSGCNGFSLRKFESLLAAPSTGVCSLRPRGDMIVLRKVVHHRTAANSVQDHTPINISSWDVILAPGGGVVGLGTSLSLQYLVERTRHQTEG